MATKLCSEQWQQQQLFPAASTFNAHAQSEGAQQEGGGEEEEQELGGSSRQAVEGVAGVPQ